jgi:hypothetical protein
MEGSNPLFSEGWCGWLKNANQVDVLSWFADLCEKLATLAGAEICPTLATPHPLQEFLPTLVCA